MTFRTTSAGLFVVTVVLLSGCSFSFGGESPAEAAVDLIEGEEMEQQLGIGVISNAVCEDPPDEEVGTTFSCTADNDGSSVAFEVALEADDRIFAIPTNVIGSDVLAQLEQLSVEALNAENGFGLSPDAMDCGERSVVLDAEQKMSCVLTDPNSAEAYEKFEAEITITDFDSGSFSVVLVGPAE